MYNEPNQAEPGTKYWGFEYWGIWYWSFACPPLPLFALT